MSESDEKLQKGIIELDRGNDKKAFEYFKEVFESRQERLIKKVQENPKSPTLMLDALYMIHGLVWLRVAEAGTNKDQGIELLGKAVGTVEAAKTALGPLVTGLAQWAKEKNIKAVQNKALGLLAATKDLEDMAKKALEAHKKRK
ncbi:MAG: hypothetical protein C4K49_04200 [Candidatus Thorarchaeota archaeon]|nr:MAG: hypothetical protein C4K49_04200 [Candidatus Thorarchaeota archaeon]